MNLVGASVDEIITRGRDATTFVTLPFWKDMQEYLSGREQQRLKAIEDAKSADALIVKGLVFRWQVEKELIGEFLRYPYAAIEAARDAGGING